MHWSMSQRLSRSLNVDSRRFVRIKLSSDCILNGQVLPWARTLAMDSTEQFLSRISLSWNVSSPVSSTDSYISLILLRTAEYFRQDEQRSTVCGKSTSTFIVCQWHVLRLPDGRRNPPSMRVNINMLCYDCKYWTNKLNGTFAIVFLTVILFCSCQSGSSIKSGRFVSLSYPLSSLVIESMLSMSTSSILNSILV